MPAKFREIRRRIGAVESTKQITKAMELIATSRILRAERAVKQSRPFSDKIDQVIRDLGATSENLKHPLLEGRGGPAGTGGVAEQDARPTALVVITADRGLAGAYNANVLRMVERQRRELGVERTQLYAVGRKAVAAFKFRRIPMAEQWTGFTDNPAYADAQAIGSTIIQHFLEGRIGAARIVYTQFKSMMVQAPVSTHVLPVQADVVEGGRPFPPVYEFEPEPDEILSQLLPMYVEMKVFHALLEAAASEHASRRRAMSAASDNADELISTLTRVANAARQSEITSELADIVGGAEAVQAK